MSKGIMGFVVSFLMGQQEQTPDADRYERVLQKHVPFIKSYVRIVFIRG